MAPVETRDGFRRQALPQHVPDGPALADVRLALLVVASALPFYERRKRATGPGDARPGEA